MVMTGIEETVTEKFCVAPPAVLLAVMVPEKVPTAVGVPEMTPLLERLNPVGRLPAVTLKVGVGKPEAV